MKKEMKKDNRYLICNLDEPYAPAVLEAIYKGEEAKSYGSWKEPTDFKDWCLETFGGCYMPYIEIHGEKSYWIDYYIFKGLVAFKRKPSEFLYNIIFEEFLGGNEEKITEYSGIPHLDYIKNRMYIHLVQAKNCKEIPLFMHRKHSKLWLKWEWVDKVDLEREWRGF